MIAIVNNTLLHFVSWRKRARQIGTNEEQGWGQGLQTANGFEDH